MSEEEKNLVNKIERWINKEEEYCTNENLKELLNILDKYVDLYKAEKEKNKELEKYDYRKIKIDEKNKISSIHFTKEQLDLMNLGIALYVGIPKILADKEDEETDI